MKPLASLAALVSLAATAPQAARPLDVQFQMDGNSAIRATITNNGKKDLKIFRTGTILDSSAIQKTRITDVDGTPPLFLSLSSACKPENWKSEKKKKKKNSKLTCHRQGHTFHPAASSTSTHRASCTLPTTTTTRSSAPSPTQLHHGRNPRLRGRLRPQVLPPGRQARQFPV
ncbi:hypothetical protein J3459_011201 [Metarhizium acridum]|nr:hypothetical protein J3459_011201 [Metarhizium acridum]